MVIHSIIPEEIIFPQTFSAKKQVQNILVEDGVILEVMHSHENVYEVVRLISTDPKQYLKGIYQPGSNLQISRSSKS